MWWVGFYTSILVCAYILNEGSEVFGLVAGGGGGNPPKAEKVG